VRLFSIGAVMALNLFILVRYVWLIRHRKIQPALAMWVLFTIAVVASFVTYLSEGGHGPLDNILNTSDIVLVGSVSVAILVTGDKTSRFTRFDLGCLAAVAAILVFWAFTREHAAAHLAIQAILVIAYFPVVRRIWKTDRNTEPFSPRGSRCSSLRRWLFSPARACCPRSTPPAPSPARRSCSF